MNIQRTDGDSFREEAAFTCLDLAEETFMKCRHGGACGDHAVLLLDALAESGIQSRAFNTRPGDWRDRLPPRDGMFVMPNTYPVKSLAELSQESRTLLDLLRTGAEEAILLEADGRTDAIRRLGYALHAMPRLISTEEKFRPKFFEFGVQAMATAWPDYSQAMRTAIAGVVKMDQEELETLVRKEGFAIRLF